jgi:hypothetical protein
MKKNIKKPNFFIVGAPRSGTTTLYYTLKEHPDVFMSPTKEPLFFNTERTEKEWTNYMDLFKNASKEKIIGEASPSNLYFEESPRLIKKYCANAKILIQLRDPVERTISYHKLLIKQGRQKLSFKEALKKEDKIINGKINLKFHYCDKSLYYHQVKRFYDLFGKNNVKVTIFEDFVSNPRKILKEICSFLKIDPMLLPKNIRKYNSGNKARIPSLNRFIIIDSFFKKFLKLIIPKEIARFCKSKFLLQINDSKIPIEVKISEEEKLIFRRRFVQDIKKLEKLINRDLNHWLPKDE